MDCSLIEQRLSEYMESALPADELSEISEHLKSCENCTALLGEMRAIVLACHNYPALEMDEELLGKILLRTSGRPQPLSLRERIQWLLQPLLAPRFAVGAGLAAMFLALTFNFMTPRVPGGISSVSALELFNWMDRGAQYAYGEGLKASDKKNEWMAEFHFFKINTANKLRYMMERIDVPVEGRTKPDEPAHEKKQAPGERSSHLLSWQACLEKKFQTDRFQV
jgi:hypothetical protein